ncbi:hypothetical protein B0H19DRAFT_1275736 [Mycena capillaripes]|nr:hypothetical protein B0H19DRAFT_1275736 [Mycena capillaripes]
MPQPVVLHASVSRAAWTTTCAYSAIPSSHRWRMDPSLHSSAHRYALVRGHRHADPVFTGVLRRAWTCARTATSVSYPSAIDTLSRTTHASQVAFASVRILATIDAHDLQARLSVSPHHPACRRLLSLSSSSTSSFARWRLTRIAGGALRHGHVDPVRDTTLECALRRVLCVPEPRQLPSVFRTPSHDPLLLALSSLCAHTFCLFMIYPSFVPPSPPSRVRLHSSSLSNDDPVLSFALAPSFPLHHPVRASLRNPGPRRPPSPLPPAPVRTHTTPTHRGPCSFREDRPPPLQRHLFLHRHHPHIVPTSNAVPQHEHRDVAHEGSPEAQAQHYEDNDAWFVLKHHCTTISTSRRLRCSRPPGPQLRWKWAVVSIFRFSISSVRTVYPGSLPVARWMDVARMSRRIYQRTTELGFVFAFHCCYLYPPEDYINTSSIPPFITRAIVGCFWLLLFALELFLVVRMWLWLATIMFSTFLLSPSFLARREISLLPAWGSLRTSLFTIPFYFSVPISRFSYRTPYICT